MVSWHYCSFFAEQRAVPSLQVLDFFEPVGLLHSLLVEVQQQQAVDQKVDPPGLELAVEMVEAVIEEVTASKSSVATLLGAKKKEAPVHDNPSNRVPNEEIVTDPKDAPGLDIPPPLQILSPAGDLDVLISSRQLNPSPERLPESLKEAAEGNDTNLDTGRLDLNHNNISKGADDDKHT